MRYPKTKLHIFTVKNCFCESVTGTAYWYNIINIYNTTYVNERINGIFDDTTFTSHSQYLLLQKRLSCSTTLS